MPNDEFNKVELPAINQLKKLNWKYIEGNKLSPDEHIIINWWTHQDIIDTGGNDVTWDEWKHLVNTINGSQDWDYIQDAAIEEACNIVARRQDLFKDKSG